jgi:KaiC/GvpD/RAD55 family RecA-like ATPase
LATANLVVVVEGEKCAEAACSIGFTATTSAHGANSLGKTDWTPLAGRDVLILPDNDDAGRHYAQHVARILTGLHPPARVKIVELPGLCEHGDIVDFIEARECRDSDDICREIEALAAATPWYVPANDAPPTDSLPADEGPPWLTIAEIGAQPTYRDGLVPITTGYECLDDALRGGFRPECVYVVAGRTGNAKSTLPLNVTRRVALVGESVLHFKLEESPREAVYRLHAAAAQVDLRLLLDGASRVTGSDRRKLLDGWSLICTLPVRVSACRTLPGIHRIAREHAEQGGKLIVVDQLSMVQVDGADVGYQQATAVSNALRRLAVELRVPVVLVCQVNRAAAKNEGHLSLHDLRDSGAIENDATAVVLIDKVREPEHAWRAAELIRHLDIIIGKNRYGPASDPERPLTLTWFPRCCRIEEPADVAHTPQEGAA